MDSLSFRPSDTDVENVVKTYSNMLFKLCFTILRSSADAEDAVSDTMVKYMTKAPEFTGEEHRKAWLIRVATNISRNMIKLYKRRSHLTLDDIADFCKTEESTSVVNDVLMLPVKYRTVMHLYYIVGYKTDEIADILSISPGAVRKRLQYGREKLKLEYGKDAHL